MAPSFVELRAAAGAGLFSASSLLEEAAAVLHEAFAAQGSDAWPDLKSAREEVLECAAEPNLCVGLVDGGALQGWVGLRPQYDRTWELHPLAVRPASQGRGYGRMLMEEIERRARLAGLEGITLGTDDERFQTSLSHVDLDGSNLLGAIASIRDLAGHPFAFYRRCGYAIVGVIPNANGRRKPDIWMWKSLL